MIKKYIEHMKTYDPHERRQHAARISAGILSAVFMVWITTIGWRFANIPTQSPNDTTDSQLANVINGADAANGAARLIVSTTTQYNPYGN